MFCCSIHFKVQHLEPVLISVESITLHRRVFFFFHRNKCAEINVLSLLCDMILLNHVTQHDMIHVMLTN